MAKKKTSGEMAMSMSDAQRRKEEMMYRAKDMVKAKMMEHPMVKKEIQRVMKEMLALEKGVMTPSIKPAPKSKAKK